MQSDVYSKASMTHGRISKQLTIKNINMPQFYFHVTFHNDIYLRTTIFLALCIYLTKPPRPDFWASIMQAADHCATARTYAQKHVGVT
jgi:hypothetical protein